MKLLNELRYAWKRLLAAKLFSILIVSVIGVGCGLCIYMYSFLNTIAFKDLPLKQSSQIVTVSGVIYGQHIGDPSIGLHDFGKIRQNLESVEELGAYSEGAVTIAGLDSTRRYNAAWVEPQIFAFTRVKPLLGRSFAHQDNLDGSPATVIISNDVWQRQFGGDKNILKQTMSINGVTSEIIGVMPKNYSFPRASEIWLPLQQNPLNIERGTGRRVAGYARLKPGITVAQANKEVSLIMARIEKRYPKTNSSIGAFVSTFQITAIGQSTLGFILAMAGVVALTLLLLFVNVGNLLLARTNKFSRDTAVRIALGAPRRNIINLMVFESGILCSLGAAIGLIIATVGLQMTGPATASFTGRKPFYWWQFGIDTQTLLLVFLLMVLGILLVGFLPAMRAVKSDFNKILREGSRGGESRKSKRINSLLVISEVFLSTVILLVASLLAVSTLQATSVDYGAKTNDYLTARVSLANSGKDQAQQWRFWSELKQELHNQPNITNVALMSSLPGVWSYQSQMVIEGKEYDERNYPRANAITLYPGSLNELNVKLLQGRFLSQQDLINSTKVAVITNNFSRQHWSGKNPLGERFKLRDTDGEASWFTVVGVVNDVVHGQPFSANAKAPTFYLPASQKSAASMMLAINYQGPENTAKQTLRQTLLLLDSSIAVFDIKPFEQLIKQNTAGVSFISNIFLLFGFVALLLAASGIFGVMANTVIQKTQEIGIRRALGAPRRTIRNLFFLRGSKQLSIGLILAIISGIAIAKPIVTAFSPSNIALYGVFITVPIIVSLVVFFAIFIPVRQALTIEPNVALRKE